MTSMDQGVDHATKGLDWAQSEWTKRRKRLDLILAFLAFTVFACYTHEMLMTWFDKKYGENSIIQTIAITSLTTLGTLMIAYMGVGAWDDKNSKQTNLEAMALELKHIATVEGKATPTTTATVKNTETVTAEATTTK